MLDVPVDGWYAWVGVAITSVVLLGTATGLPSEPPPDASGVATTVDRAAGATHGSSGVHPLDATHVSVSPTRVGLRNGAGRVHATFAYGPVTPVPRGGRLERVLAGEPPDRVFETTAAFRERVSSVDHRGRWRRVDGPLRVRHLVLEGRDVTLVGA